MTALEQYQRLEALGVWRATPDAAPREVVVSFGNSTLVLTDLADRPLTHWALAGTEIVDRADGATIYSATGDADETLALSDAAMIAAIESVSQADRLAARPADLPRKRLWPVWIALLLAAATVTALYAPDIIRARARAMVPPERAAEFGDRMLLALMDERGALCATPTGQRALEKLAARAAPGTDTSLRVLALETTPVAALPGRALLLDRHVIESANSAPAVVGWIVLGHVVASARDPMDEALAAAGFLASLNYVFTGRLSDAALTRAASAALAPPTAGEIARTLAILGRAAIPAGPFLEAAQQAGLPVRAARPSPPLAPKAPPLLLDQDWTALEAICNGGAARGATFR